MINVGVGLRLLEQLQYFSHGLWWNSRDAWEITCWSSYIYHRVNCIISPIKYRPESQVFCRTILFSVTLWQVSDVIFCKRCFWVNLIWSLVCMRAGVWRLRWEWLKKILLNFNIYRPDLIRMSLCSIYPFIQNRTYRISEGLLLLPAAVIK